MVTSLTLLRYSKVQVFIHVSDTVGHHSDDYRLHAVSKQMKTINFSLSSSKHVTQGWVVRVSSGRHHQVTQQINHRRKRRRERPSVPELPAINFRNDVSTTKVCKHICIIMCYHSYSFLVRVAPLLRLTIMELSFKFHYQMEQGIVGILIMVSAIYGSH